nr:TetR-like C-terminal domain-containing protein [Deinobacterium chartae]
MHTAHTPLDRLQALAVAYVRFGLTYPMHYRLMFMQGSDFLTACAEGKQPRVASLNLLIHAVEQAITAGDLDGNRVSAQQLTAALWSAVHGPVSLHLSQPALLPLPLVLPTAQTLVQATLDRFSPPG